MWWGWGVTRHARGRVVFSLGPFWPVWWVVFTRGILFELY